MKKTFVFFFISAITFAQTDTVHLLNEVRLFGNFSPIINSGYQVQILTDSSINERQQSLGNLLQDQANLYFKQNGNGMVSSISLRGSGAAHTGVYWNGIAINSQLDGQTDFNTFSANSYNQIEIRKGGGGILFGSGAIGGAINLRDQIVFVDKLQTDINLGLASFNTQKALVSTQYSDQKMYAKIAIEGNQSDNDYPYLDTDLTNENGAYSNYHFKGVFGYKINQNNQLQFFATSSNNDRNLSRTITAPNNSKLTNKQNRILLNWKSFGAVYNSSLKLAYLDEEYNFYFDRHAANYSFGKNKNYLVKYDFKYFLKNNMSFHTGVENSYTKANGTNLIKADRNNFEAYALVHQKPLKNLLYNLSVRKGFSSVYKIPLIYGLDIKYGISPKLDIKANFSTNYRLPTYNDLYWNPGGNSTLLAEDSKTGELGINYHKNNIALNITSYYTKSTNLIQWRPITNTLWQPVNVQNVDSYGLDFEFKTQRKFNNQSITLISQYGYTVATDNNLDKQLIYVPYHKANMSLSYNNKYFTIKFKEYYNGKVFTTTSNTQSLDAYWLSNVEIYKSFLRRKLTIGFITHNLWNKAYQSVAYRPMPNRNCELNINYKF